MNDSTLRPNKANNENLTLEVAHVIWFNEKGYYIKNSDKLSESWQRDVREYYIIAAKLLQTMDSRGITVTFYDTELSHFSRGPAVKT